jgi:hypothetical protein
VLGQAKLHDDFEPAEGEIIPVADARDAPGITHDAVEFTALDGEHDLLRAEIPGDRLEPGSDQRIERCVVARTSEGDSP